MKPTAIVYISHLAILSVILASNNDSHNGAHSTARAFRAQTAIRR